MQKPCLKYVFFLAQVQIKKTVKGIRGIRGKWEKGYGKKGPLSYTPRAKGPANLLADCHLIIHADGGTRAHQCSASTWIVEVAAKLGNVWMYKLLAMGGTNFGDPISSFLAEGIALEEGSIFIRKLVSMCGPGEPPAKRQRMA